MGGWIAFPQGSLWRERPPEGRVNRELRSETATPPGAAPAVKKGGSLPPLSPPLVRRADAPGEAGTRGGGALPRFTAQDSGNPCHPMPNVDFQE